jgi:hypothetical protein
MVAKAQACNQAVLLAWIPPIVMYGGMLLYSLLTESTLCMAVTVMSATMHIFRYQSPFTMFSLQPGPFIMMSLIATPLFIWSALYILMEAVKIW